MIHYYTLLNNTFFICLSSFILSYLLSLIFPLCFLVVSELILESIYFNCSPIVKVCSIFLYFVKLLYNILIIMELMTFNNFYVYFFHMPFYDLIYLLIFKSDNEKMCS